MKKIINKLKYTPLYELILPLIQKNQMRRWLKQGKKPPTPQLIKQSIVKQIATQYSIKTFVETGTYLGSMINATKDLFEKIYTIELDPLLYRRAKMKFINFKHISIYFGDSAIVLPSVLKKIKKPTLFWLDAHYSEGITAKGRLTTPIVQEIKSILKYKARKNIILIDDALLFTGKNNYPTKRELIDYVLKKFPKAIFKIKYNVIYIILNP